jgi:Ser-tRNA(Ala) deacylase AlaX
MSEDINIDAIKECIDNYNRLMNEMVDEEKKVKIYCKILNARKELESLVQRVQDAEHLGWALKDKYMHLKKWDDVEKLHRDYTYDEAIAEREKQGQGA